MAALARLLERASALGASEPEHDVFLASAEKLAHRIGANWFGKQPGVLAGRPHKRHSNPEGSARPITAWKRAAAPIRGLRFHLRHQAITEMAEAGASDATLMAVVGHMSRRML